MSDSVSQHKANAPAMIPCAVVTVSDTRTLETDRGGQLVCDLLRAAGHQVVRREIVKDEPVAMTELIRSMLSSSIEVPQLGDAGEHEVEQFVERSVVAILMTGGTGITARDQTFETVSELITKSLPGYGELFRMLSFEEIGAAAMLSRATGGLIDRTVLLTMPGSTAAVRLAMERLILPELPHLVQQANS